MASQCLQSAYALTSEDKHLEVSRTLENIFQESTKSEPVSTFHYNHLPPFHKIMKFSAVLELIFQVIMIIHEYFIPIVS